MTKNQIHEWRERDEEGVKRYYRGYWNSREWTFAVLEPGAEDWQSVPEPTIALWKSLRDVIFRKYQRKRLPHKFVAQLDEIIQELDGAPSPQSGEP